MNQEWIVSICRMKGKLEELRIRSSHLIGMLSVLRNQCDHKYADGRLACRPRYDTKQNSAGGYDVLCYVCDFCNEVGLTGPPMTPAERATSTETWRKEREKHEQARQEQARQEQARQEQARQEQARQEQAT